VLAPLGIEGGDNTSRGRRGPLDAARHGHARAVPAARPEHYFDWHHTANDTLDKVDPEALKQAVAAYAAVVWIAANVEG
jgi:carboxypeptidase Q